ncbi:hypothetical protein CS542_06215 [Pedobacter sp. IW39]|nr:hypothetical protein CS542_06215 [Pedobacter sp. IW39]
MGAVSSMEGTSTVPLLTIGITEQEKEGFVLHRQQTMNGRFYPYVKGLLVIVAWLFRRLTFYLIPNPAGVI